MNNDFMLVVGEGTEPDETAQALSEAHDVRRCAGTANVECPAMLHERCDLRVNAIASVVFLSGEHEIHGPGQWTCVTASATPAVAVLEGSSFPMRGSAGFAIVGSSGGPGAIGEAIERATNPDPPLALVEERLD